MLKVRITAIRQTVYPDLIAQYENPIEHACDIRQGQQWISVNGNCPDGLCPSAWESMRPFVESLAQGKGNFFDGWMKNPMSAMISCNDGFRPFSFYIEAIEEESQAAHEQSENQPQSGTEKTCSQPTPRLIPKDKEEARVQVSTSARQAGSATPTNHRRPGYAPTEPPHLHKQLLETCMGTRSYGSRVPGFT